MCFFTLLICTEGHITSLTFLSFFFFWSQDVAEILLSKWCTRFPGGSVVKNLPANAGDAGLIPESRRSPGEGNGKQLQYSCLENPIDREAWWATVHRVTRSQTWLKQLRTDASLFTLPDHWSLNCALIGKTNRVTVVGGLGSAKWVVNWAPALGSENVGSSMYQI